MKFKFNSVILTSLLTASVVVNGKAIEEPVAENYNQINLNSIQSIEHLNNKRCPRTLNINIQTRECNLLGGKLYQKFNQYPRCNYDYVCFLPNIKEDNSNKNCIAIQGVDYCSSNFSTIKACQIKEKSYNFKHCIREAKELFSDLKSNVNEPNVIPPPPPPPSAPLPPTPKTIIKPTIVRPTTTTIDSTIIEPIPTSTITIDTTIVEPIPTATSTIDETIEEPTPIIDEPINSSYGGARIRIDAIGNVTIDGEFYMQSFTDTNEYTPDVYLGNGGDFPGFYEGDTSIKFYTAKENVDIIIVKFIDGGQLNLVKTDISRY